MWSVLSKTLTSSDVSTIFKYFVECMNQVVHVCNEDIISEVGMEMQLVTPRLNGSEFQSFKLLHLSFANGVFSASDKC